MERPARGLKKNEAENLSIIRATETWQRAGTCYIRIQAMAKKHHIPLRQEFDEHDGPETKYIVVTDDGFPIATARMYALDRASVMIGRVVVLPEYRYGDSRIDFYMEKGDERYLMEVKGCTLEVDGIGYFPDAPTDRGVKHIRELIRAVDDWYHAILAFVIQMDGVTEVRANTATHPEFGEALEEASVAGVKVRCLPCHVEPDALYILPGTLMI